MILKYYYIIQDIMEMIMILSRIVNENVYVSFNNLFL